EGEVLGRLLCPLESRCLRSGKSTPLARTGVCKPVVACPLVRLAALKRGFLPRPGRGNPFVAIQPRLTASPL
ncbi:hypothetical protein K0M31_013710, partial [Melipona bicolor]